MPSLDVKAALRRAAGVVVLMLVTTATVGVSLAVEGDVVLKREGGDQGTPRAVFPHWIHRIRYRCYACHPAPFPMKGGATSMPMDVLREGKLCGSCHDDKTAFGITFETCNRCHVPKTK
jgi:c(7)-type cytochrome triheme protein